MGWLLRRLRGERPLFRTHLAPFQATEWAPGELVAHEGVFFRVTRWEELPATHLVRGGSVQEWEVWGRRADDDEVAAAAAAAAERILSEEGPPRIS